MVIHINGDLLEADVQLIAHQTNCMGVMGRGIAAQIKTKYPEIYNQYKEFCNSYINSKNLLGQCQIIKLDDNKYIANLFGQYNYQPKNIRHTDYGALQHALIELKEWCKENNITTIGIPDHLGCGVAMGNWDNVVLPMIQNLFEEDNDITLIIVKLN